MLPGNIVRGLSMPDYSDNATYPNFNADEAFKILVAAIPDMGYTIWKTRPLGWLIMANRETDQGIIHLSLSLRPGPTTELNLSLASEDYSTDELRKDSSELMALINQRLA